MSKKYWKTNNNKGVAMVTVLISVTFIGLLATSLMYMAYMNYLTKIVRYKSTDNFYTDEMALDEISTALQQTAAKNKTSIDTAKTQVLSKAGVSTSTWANGSYTYNASNLADLAVNTAAMNGVTITTSANKIVSGVATPSTSGTATISGNCLTLEGLMVTTNGKDSLGADFQTTITTDFSIYFNNSLAPGMKVNDFSIITDDWIEQSNGSRVFEGNMYVENRNVTAAKRKVGGSGPEHYTAGDGIDQAKKSCSIWVHNNAASVSMVSPKAIFVGDVVVEEGSSLSIAGNTSIFGNLVIADGSLVTVSGDLYLTGTVEIKDAQSKLVSKAGGTNIHENYALNWSALPGIEGKDEYAPGMCEYGLFYPMYYFLNNGGTNDGTWYKYLLTDNTSTQNLPTTTSRKTGVYMRMPAMAQNTWNNNDYDNSLIMLSYWDGTLDANGSHKVYSWDIRAELKNATILTRDHIVCTDAGASLNSYMGHLSDEDYDAAKDTFFYNGQNRQQYLPAYKVTSSYTFKDNVFAFSNVKTEATQSKDTGYDLLFFGSSSNNDCDKVDSIDATIWGNYVSYLATQGKTAPEKTWDNFVLAVKYDVDKNKASSNYRYATFDDSPFTYILKKDSNGKWVNYVPTYYLLNKESDKMVEGVFSSIMGKEDATNTLVIYNNWIKD